MITPGLSNNFSMVMTCHDLFSDQDIQGDIRHPVDYLVDLIETKVRFQWKTQVLWNHQKMMSV